MEPQPTRKRNRNTKRSARPGWNWCLACDMAQVADGSKCPECGNRNGNRKEKKIILVERDKNNL